MVAKRWKSWLVLGLIASCLPLNRAKSAPPDGPAESEIDLPRIILRGGGHFPVLTKLREGGLAFVCRGRFEHVVGDASLDLVRSVDDGRHWTNPRTIIDEQAIDERNPAFGQLADGTLLLAYTYYDLEASTWGGLWYMRSENLGRTWDEPKRVYDPPDGGYGSPFGKILQLKDGTALLAFYTTDDFRQDPIVNDGIERAWFLRSQDSGKTWGDPSLIAAGHNEAALVDFGNGKIGAAIRRSPGPEQDSLSWTTSSDQGYSWAAPIPLRPQGEHPGDLLQLKDGRLLLVYGTRRSPGRLFENYNSDESIVQKMGVEAQLSSDGGKTWGKEIVLDRTAPNFDCGYPSSVQLDDGRVVTLYYVTLGKADYDLAGTQTRMIIWRP
ncbi:MAG: glycoside hydrolase [Pirellulaceae bacterium]|nr:glycoside hydrolase [Pirellulaceae bacterium]